MVITTMLSIWWLVYATELQDLWCLGILYRQLLFGLRKMLSQYREHYLTCLRHPMEQQGEVGLIFVFRFSLFVFRFSFFVFRFSFFDIRTESENRILTFKILFWHSNWVGKSNFDIQNSILTFELSRKMLFWYSKSYFDIRTESENRILTFEILFWHSNRVKYQNRILNIKIAFSDSVRISK